MRQKKKKKLSKSKKKKKKKKTVQIFADVLRCVIFHAYWGESLSFCRRLSAVALLVIQKFELNFEVMLNITIFIIFIQNPLESAPTL